MIKPNARLIAVAISLAIAMAGCSSKPAVSASKAGRQACKERQADLPPDTTAEAMREEFRQCLKTIDSELSRQRQQAQQQRNTEMQQTALEAEQRRAAMPSTQARFNHCQQVQQQVQEAERMRIRTLAAAMAATRTYGADSREAQDAQSNFEEAVATLERLIPSDMRGGKSLIPDATEVFRRCDPSDFDAS